MARPYFSIVIPTYNRERAILRSVGSCLNQTFGDFEVVVVDDGSTDGTSQAVKGIDDDRVRLISQENRGAAGARNTGIAQARGEYVAFLDSDDVFLPQKLALFKAHIEKTGDDLVYSQVYVDRGVGNYWVRPDHGMARGQDLFDYLFVDHGWINMDTLVLRSSFAKSTLFREDLSYGDDIQFAVDVWKQGASISMIDEPTAIYADEFSEDRLSQSLSRSKGDAADVRFFNWVESQRDLMSDKAYLAYRAHHFSRHLARISPWGALRDILKAHQAGALSLKAAVRQAVQTFFPRSYRRLADFVARHQGKRIEDGVSSPVNWQD